MSYRVVIPYPRGITVGFLDNCCPRSVIRSILAEAGRRYGVTDGDRRYEVTDGDRRYGVTDGDRRYEVTDGDWPFKLNSGETPNRKSQSTTAMTDKQGLLDKFY